MSKYDRELSNLSYTNKDFGRIYPELLDLASKISYRWDPSKSDESDPGVVLLKLAALIGDKNNYNIDKNILELFPASVTQDRNARQIFDQCGYTMKHYRSSIATLYMIMKTEPDYLSDKSKTALGINNIDEAELQLDKYERCYILPQFTMFSNEDNSLIYTTTEKCTVRSNGEEVSVPIIQGTAVDFSINGETLITPQYLDYNNRLYFSELDIAENGIFILDSKGNQSNWNKVDNLIIQPYGSKCYKFGVSIDGSTCYIEFPSDIDSLMGEGIKIKYIRTLGVDGNVKSGVIHQLYVDTSVDRHVKDLLLCHNVEHDVPLTTENLYITNSASIVRGAHPETISEANRNYQKIKNTFETLVSTKDYSNYFYTNEYMSNGFVCDRSDDIQSSYVVSDVTSDSVEPKVKILQDETGTDELSPFDLRVYGLTYVPNVSTKEDFSRSFTLITKQDSKDLWNNEHDESYLLKLVSHNYQDFIPYRIILLKNKFPIVARIIPKQRLTDVEKKNLSTNVVNALYPVINSRMIEFGEPANYELIYDTIMNADARIQALSLEDFEYETYAVYVDDNHIPHEIRIDGAAVSYKITKDKSPKSDKIYYIQDMSGQFIPQPMLQKFLDHVLYYEPDEDTELRSRFQEEIYTKSIAAGITPLCTSENEFTYALHQEGTKRTSGITHFTSETFIPLSCSTEDTTTTGDGTTDSNDKSYVTYKSKALSSNENVVFYAPIYEPITVNGAKAEFSSYVKIVHNIRQPNYQRPSYNYENNELPTTERIAIKKDETCCLQPGEYAVFFWKEVDSEDQPYHFIKISGDRENSYKEASAIHASSNVPIQTHPSNTMLPKLPDDVFRSLPVYGTTTTSNVIISGSTIDGTKDPITGNYIEHPMDISLHDYVASLQGNQFVLSGTTSLTAMKESIIHCPKAGDSTSTAYVSWSVNNESNTIFTNHENSESGSYVLKSGEYFRVADTGFSTYNEFGAGTIISYYSIQKRPPLTSVKRMDLQELQSNPTAFLDASTRSEYWVKLTASENESITITPTEYYQLGKGTVINLVRNPVRSKNSELELPSTISIGNSRYIASGDHTIESGVFAHTPKELLDMELYNIQLDLGVVSLEEFDISYTDSNHQTHELPPRGGASCWNAYSMLNIDVSPTIPQHIDANQYVKLQSDQRDSSIEEVDVVNPGNYLMIAPAVNKTGGINVEVKYVDILKDDLQPVNTYVYSIDNNLFGNSTDWSYCDSQTTLHIKSGDEFEYKVPVTLPSGFYIFQIENSSTMKSLQYSLESSEHNSSEVVQCLFGNCANSGTHYIWLILEGKDGEIDGITASNASLVLKGQGSYVDGESATYDITFKKCFRFIPTMSQSIAAWIYTADKVRCLAEGVNFDPTYIIPSSELIEWPLNAKSFFNLNHIFNKCTISQWNLSDNAQNIISVLDKVK